MIYVDTSALLKVVRSDEPSADEVRTFIADAGPLVSSRLLAVEMHLAGRRAGIDEPTVRRLLARVDQVAINEDVIGAAIRLNAGLRSLDAIHLGTAVYLGEDVSSVLTFDHRMAAAADRVGLALASLV